MKVSLNWVKEYADVNVPTDELVEKIGAQLGAVEEVVDLSERYAGIVVARIISCYKHPNADKLQVCQIDDGGMAQNIKRNTDGYVQVVCGAPNAKEGLTVAWIPPGGTVPATADKEPFVLESRDIRGETSNGMLASAKELALSDDHSGILELDKKLIPGTALSEVFTLDDTVIEIENKMFTHRPDCFGLIGVAREIAGITHQQFVSPEWYLRVTRSLVFPATDRLPISVDNQLPELVKRFMVITMKDVKIKPSPLWLQSHLTRVGLRPINNIVDITNYLMYLTGQPLHAYDYDKLAAQTPSGQKPEIAIRFPETGEKITLLNGKEITPRPGAIMIASPTKLIGVGGVMGGADTEVDDKTKNIAIEVASFDMYSIRRTSMEHGLFTDAVTRFNKGQSPLQNDKVLAKAIEMVQELAEGQVGGKLIDDIHVDEGELARVTVGATFINDRLGFALSPEEMATLLRNVEFTVEIEGDKLHVTVPFWRTDIETPEDLVEEVGRLYGFDHLPVALPSRDLTPAAKNEMLEFKARLRAALSAGGANEVLTYSFVHGNLLDKVGQNKDDAFQLSNAISPDLQYLRLSLTPSLLDKVHPNIKAGFDDFAMFELGKTHTKQYANSDEGLPREFHQLALVVAANDKSQAAQSGAAYYRARQYLDYLGVKLGLSFDYQPLEGAHDNAVTKPFEPSRTAIIRVRGSDTPIGVVGEFTAATRRGLKLPLHSAGFEVNYEELLQAVPSADSYVPLSRYPKIVQDISLRVPSGTNYYNVYMTLVWALPDLAPKDTTATIEPLDIYQSQEDQDHKSFTFHVTAVSEVRTLKTEELSKLLDDLAGKAKNELGAERL